MLQTLANACQSRAQKNSASQKFAGSRIGMTDFRGCGEETSRYEHQLLTSKRCTSYLSLYPKSQSLLVPKQKLCGHAEPIVKRTRTSIRLSEKLKKVNQF